jgi:sulfatase maturation enzyme AslB (radical SAM superfamily)
MEFSRLTFILTEECNFDCAYCFQKDGNKIVDVSAVNKAIDFFFPRFRYNCDVSFTGGEPLLAFDKLREAVNHIQAKGGIRNIHYYLTTNGSLIDDNILQFLNRHKFSILLSFDGIAQDISRKKGSHCQIVSVIEKMAEYPDIALKTNSVFTPETVGYLSQSIQFLMDLEIPKIILALSTISAWDDSSLLHLKHELIDLKKFLVSHYRKTGAIPLSNFRKSDKKDIFVCVAGRNRMALDPEGKLWGCHLFPDYFKEKKETVEYHKYCFGDLDSFIEDHEKIYPEILVNYADLRLDRFYTDNESCDRCLELEECWICPMNAALSSSILGKIPYWLCEINRIIRQVKKSFWEELV